MTYPLSKTAERVGSRPRVKYPVGRLIGRVVEGTGILLTLFFITAPILWLILTAFKSEKDAYTTKVIFTPTLDNFRAIFSEPLQMQPLVINSVVVSLATIAISIPVAMMAAYVFSRYLFRGSSVLLVWVLTTQFIPPVVVALPFFNLFRRFGLIDTRVALVILNLSIVLPYAIWMIKGFIDALPTEVEEAALVDGATEFTTLRYITFPLIMPGVIVSAAFAFIMSWNEFLFALIMTRSTAKTLQVGLLSTIGVRGVQWEWMSAVGIIVMIPIFLLSLTIRKHFVQGLTMGAVK